MVKTSVYLPDELKGRLSEASRISGESEATIIRSALEKWLAGMLRPRTSRHWGAIDFGDSELVSKLGDALSAIGRGETISITRGNRVVAEVVPAHRRTGADLRAALQAIPPPDDRFVEDIAGALALLTAEGNDAWAGS
jgi:antitoxin (DNA-binding transcriptional repressor) of toxin-antitoxin stability system